MKLSRKDLLKGCKQPKEIEALIVQAEEVLRTRQPNWSKFISAPLREEAIRIFTPLIDLYCFADGGYQNAERQRVGFRHYSIQDTPSEELAPISGLQITGNFLFDPVTPHDFYETLMQTGVALEHLGDLWIVGDRGAQGLCTPEAASAINGLTNMVRDVEVHFEVIDQKELRFPNQRMPKKLSTVEASKRLDAIASAGFGLSRAKVVNQIKQGRLRLNWIQIKQASKELSAGDRIQLEGKGSLEVLNLELTKRQRWRIELLRQ